MRTAITTKPLPFLTTAGIVWLPEGRPVITVGWDLVDGERLYIVETELGEVCGGVDVSALDFEADW